MTRSLLVATLTLSLGVVACSGDTDGTTTSSADTGATATADTGTTARDTGVTTESPWVDTGSSTPDPECDAHEQCASSQICLESNCEAAFPRAYDIGEPYFVVPQRNAEGDTWDEFGGAPDPQLDVFLNGEPLCYFDGAEDTFEGQWVGYFCEPTVLRNGDTLSLGLWDVDPIDDDPMAGCEGSIDAQTIRDGGFGCAGSGFDFGILITAP